MFFRRELPTQITFDDRMEALRKAGFTVNPSDGGRIMVGRDGVAALIENIAGAPPRVAERAGVLAADGIAKLVDGGFQKFFLTPGGKKNPARAPDLKAIHAFEEDLREALGLVSLYNESLGT